MSFSRKKIDVSITLGTGNYGATAGGPADTIKATDLKCSVQIVKAGLPSADHAEIRVWGLTQSIINQTTDLGKPLARTRNNTVTVSAGDDDAGMSTIFTGTIMTAYGDFNDPPNACLNITAISNAVDAAKPVDPISFTGGADVVVVMNQIAGAMGKNLVNYGVSGIVLSNPYYPGTACEQMKAVATAATLNADASGDTLDIWPKDGTRGGQVADIGPQSGLVGYPEYCDAGIAVRAEFMPGLTLGGQFNLTTSITNAKGLWNIINLTYDLESETPNGAWFIDMTATRPSAGGGI